MKYAFECLGVLKWRPIKCISKLSRFQIITVTRNVVPTIMYKSCSNYHQVQDRIYNGYVQPFQNGGNEK